MEKTEKTKIRPFYQADGIRLGEADGTFYLRIDQKTYRLGGSRAEPNFSMTDADGKCVIIHNSFTVEELCRAAKTNGSIRMITGDTYGIGGVFALLRKALELSRESVDIDYVEASRFMDLLKERGARSPEDAVDLTDAGMKNPNVMNSFLHSKKVGRTADGLFYMRSKERGSEPEPAARFFRVISNQVRFGCGFRTCGGKRQYFAWHGYPNRNDDYFTTAEISESEYRQIEAEYPEEIVADRETAEAFRSKYVDGHPVILEGWNKLL